MKQHLGWAIASMILVGAIGGASAADLPVKAPPPVPELPSWTGFYIGGHFGPGWSRSDTWTFVDPNGVIGPTNLINQATSLGFVAGVHAGFNWHRGRHLGDDHS